MTRWIAGGSALALLILAGCGHSEEEMMQKQTQIDALTEQVRTLRLAAMPPVYGYGYGPPSSESFQKLEESLRERTGASGGCDRSP